MIFLTVKLQYDEVIIITKYTVNGLRLQANVASAFLTLECICSVPKVYVQCKLSVGVIHKQYTLGYTDDTPLFSWNCQLARFHHHSRKFAILIRTVFHESS